MWLFFVISNSLIGNLKVIWLFFCINRVLILGLLKIKRMVGFSVRLMFWVFVVWLMVVKILKFCWWRWFLMVCCVVGSGLVK